MKEYQKDLYKKRVDELIEKSTSLLVSEVVLPNDFEDFYSSCRSFMKEVKEMEFGEVIVEIAKSALRLDLRVFNGWLIKVFNWILNWRVSKTFNAPYLIRNSQSDVYKRYIFNMKFKLEGIKYNLSIN